MKIHFHKYQGTGNDFVLIDNRNQAISLTQEQIAHLCDRRFGIGADGLMLLELEPGLDFKMVYYNSDGRESSMCGNGGRCITAFANHLGVIGNKARFLAIDGVHDAVISETGEIALKMKDVKELETNPQFHYLNTGSPHVVKMVDNLQDLNVVEEGRKIRYNTRFAEEGTNVNFIQPQEDSIYVRTYERGVEDETLSCGTGVTATALVAAYTGMGGSKNNCKILTRGGTLEVSFEKVLDHNFYNIWLKGPALPVFQGEIRLND